uniref:18.1 kDa class I heat shock protein-like n=1 Tax=Nicotiana sylvestris TaxID=4096 RepID=A0A1U7VZP7_NICSY|nr:PREDICTED: 18.1 kDa class I heat shock protein-like [Nicotiana sylvestris]
MSLMPLFNGRRSHARRVQNPSPTTTITHQSQISQGPNQQIPYFPPTTITTHQPQTSRGGQDRPAHEFYLQNPRSLIAPALSFHNEPQSIAQIEYKGTPEAHIFRANLHGYKKEEVKVQVEDERVLKITGEKKLIEKGYDNWHHFERKIGKFLTAFDLPQDARADKVNSSMENGVLIITVPKKGIKKPHVRTVRII